MSYQPLSRKYRPQTFDEIVGQEASSKTLKNSIESGRIAHAYVFFGPRGIGKTTTARVMAKALNCKKGPTTEPCGKCDACVEIAEGRSLDVMEIDAATHTQVDKVREVIVETVAFAPTRDAKKIFIIDEAHMLSNAAFNALLKTLEEPPPHVVFMLATTEPHKIPATIFSRCQRFRFSPVPAAVVREHLAKLAKKEKLHATPEALELLAKAGGGSIRDSVSLLDQAVSFAGTKLELEQVADLLGLLPTDTVLGALQAALAKDAKALGARIEEVVSAGYDASQLLRDVRDALQELYLDRLGVKPVEDAALKPLAQLRTAEAFGRLLRKVQKTLEELRYSDAPRVTLETGLYGLLEEPFDLADWVGRLEGLEARLGKAAPSAPAPLPSPQPSPRRGEGEGRVLPTPSPVSGEGRGEGPSLESDPWPSVVAKAKAEKPVLGSYLAEARASVGPTGLKLTLPSEFKKTGVQRDLAYLSALVQKAFGRELRVVVDVDATMAPRTVEDPKVSAPAESADSMAWQDVGGEGGDIAEDPGVKRVLGVFPGRVRKGDGPKQA